MNSLLCLVALLGVAVASTESPSAILGPLVEKYQDLIYSGDYEELEELYHPNAILVVKGDESPYYTPARIFEEIREARSKVGNAKTVFIKETYTGDGDIMMYENRWTITTANLELSGPYRAIWIKYEGRWVIYHEQYSQTKRHIHHHAH
ncbi:unnamed protein product, partial [Mesorhabditis spiculigera]